MAGRSSSNTVLLVLILIITFPFWIAFGAAAFGIVAGLFGAAIGLVAAVFGIVLGVITLPFRLIFGWSDCCDWSGFHVDGFNNYTLIAAVIIIGLLLTRRRR